MGHRAGGIKAKREGKGFEAFIEKVSKMQDILAIRIPDSCRRIGPRPRDLIQIKSPFDYILISRNGDVCLCDTKTVDSKSFNHSAINMNQVSYLLAAQTRGVKSGYLICFRPLDMIVFYPAQDLYKLPKNESLKPEHGIYCRTVTDSNLNAIFGLQDPTRIN